jgi:hypothetical protein
MALSTPIRIALGVGVAALAVAGFAVASGQLSPAKTTTNTVTNLPTNQITNQIGGTDQDDSDDRYERRTETRVVDAKTGQVLTEDRSRHEHGEDESHDRNDDHGGRDDD